MRKTQQSSKRVAIITEGQGEFKSLPKIYPQIQRGCGKVSIIKTLIVNVSPDAPPLTVAKKAAPTVRMAEALGADLAVILLDRERQKACPGLIASGLEQTISGLSGNPRMRISVVIKDRAFENWLIADIDALKAQKARFEVTPAIERLISPDRADRCDGQAVIKRIVTKGQYHKIEDAARICGSMDIDRAARNSRSFRHFLHAVGYEAYKQQCQVPCPI